RAGAVRPRRGRRRPDPARRGLARRRLRRRAARPAPPGGRAHLNSHGPPRAGQAKEGGAAHHQGRDTGSTPPPAGQRSQTLQGTRERENKEVVMAQDQDAQAMQPPRPDPALKRLERFVGTWNVTGRTLDSVQDNVSGRFTFEWLPGGFFLQQRTELNFAGLEVQGLEVIGYDPA